MDKNIILGLAGVAIGAAGYGIYRFLKKRREEASVVVSYIVGDPMVALNTADGFIGLVPGHHEVVSQFLRDIKAVIASGENVADEKHSGTTTFYTRGQEQVVVLAVGCDDLKVLVVYFSDVTVAQKVGIEKYINTHAAVHNLHVPDAVAAE